MRRLILIALTLGLCLWLSVRVFAQDNVPLATEEAAPPDETEFQPAVEVTAAAPLPVPTAAPVNLFSPDELRVLINVRTDMELLANEQLAGGRPVGWSGSLDVTDPQLPILVRLDLELLAGTILGPDVRPEGWFGPVPSTVYALARDARHDLELLADTAQQVNVRPAGWTGDDPLMRCSRSLQTLVNILERGGVFVLEVSVNSPEFCEEAEYQASRFAEANLLRDVSAVAAVSSTVDTAGGTGSAQVTGFAAAFLDRNAFETVGVIPVGTALTPVARSYTQFSRMTLVQGAGFEVFIDYRETSFSVAAWEQLPNLDGFSTTPSCTADWCEPARRFR